VVQYKHLLIIDTQLTLYQTENPLNERKHNDLFSKKKSYYFYFLKFLLICYLRKISKTNLNIKIFLIPWKIYFTNRLKTYHSRKVHLHVQFFSLLQKYKLNWIGFIIDLVLYIAGKLSVTPRTHQGRKRRKIKIKQDAKKTN
jgi:hypothetical protein